MVMESKRDSSMNLPDACGRTPLLVAAQAGQIESVETLLKFGADINAQALSPTELGQTALHAAISGGYHNVIQMLVENNAKLSIQDAEGNTPLHEACALGDPTTLSSLLPKCSEGDLQATNSKGETPLHLLLSMKREEFPQELQEVTRVLAKRFHLQIQDNYGVSLMHLAAYWNLEFVLKIMMFNRIRPNVKDCLGRIPLHYCFMNEKNVSIESAMYLVSNGSHPMVVDNKRMSPLNLLMNHPRSAYSEVQSMVRDWNEANINTTVGKPLLHLAIDDNNVDIIKLLIACEVDVNMKDKSGSSAMHIASADGKTEIMRILIGHGAKVNVLDNHNMTPLHYASMLSQTAAVQMLLHHKAKLNDFDEDGRTPLHKAAGWGSLDVVRYLVDYGARVNQLDFKGQNAIHIAASEGKVDTVRYLISRGVDPTLEDKSGKTPLHLAIKPANLEIIQMLLEQGVNINHQDKQGQNALHVACFYGNIDVIGALLEQGADDKAKDQGGRTPEEVGREIGQQTIMDIMVDVASETKKGTHDNNNIDQLALDVEAYKKEILAAFEEIEENEKKVEPRKVEPKRRAIEAELEDVLKRGKVHDGMVRPESFAEAEERFPERIEIFEDKIEETEEPTAMASSPNRPVSHVSSVGGAPNGLEQREPSPAIKEEQQKGEEGKQEPIQQSPETSPKQEKDKAVKCCTIL